MSPTHIHFNYHIGRKKPESIVNRETSCPFCSIDQLEEVLAADGPILLVKNKFPVLQDAFQTVLIENDVCDSDISTYSKEHLYRLFEFGMEQWFRMKKSGEYRSVMFMKNHGPYSGGTIHHPHMQIIGFEKLDYLQHTKDEHFEGVEIHAEEGVTFNLSTKPRAGFFEFNVRMDDLSGLKRLADYVQVACHYILNHFNTRCKSYNLFFYKWHEQIIVKVVPRFVTSPLYVGYSLPQVSNNIEEVVRDVRRKYLTDEII